jgi:hypothetical protein
MTTIPTLQELNDGILANFESEFRISTNPFGKAFINCLAGVLGMVIWLVYLGVAATQKNIWVDTCDYETLIRFGVIILGRYPFAATKGQYTITVTGSIGGVIPSSTVYKSDPTSASPGKLYQVATSYVLSGTSQNIVVNALEGGDDSTLDVGDTMTSTTPLLNVDVLATVLSEDIDPENAEDMELYRSKVINKIRLTPGSWNAVDYRLVGVGVTGVGEVYAYGISATGVNVWIQGTVPIANPGPSASPTVISDYTDALNLVRPLPAFTINIASCPINDIAITITMGTFPAFTADQKTIIEAALQQFVNGVRPFIAAADTATDRNDTIAQYNLGTIISQAVPGYGFSSVTFTVGGTPETVWQADNGNIAFYNGTTYL